MTAGNRKETDIDRILRLAQGLDDEQKIILVQRILEQRKKHGIPVSVFNSRLPGLEAIVKFLKENNSMSIKDMALALKRKRSTIYNAYSAARRKHPSRIETASTEITMPLEIFSARKYSILESAAWYLHDEKALSFKQISSAIGRKEGTVRTVYARYRKK